MLLLSAPPDHHTPLEDALAFLTGTGLVALSVQFLQSAELITGQIAGLSLIGWGLSKMAALRSGATGAFFRMNVLPMAGATLLSFRDRFCAPRWAQALLTVTYSVVGFSVVGPAFLAFDFLGI